MRLSILALMAGLLSTFVSSAQTITISDKATLRPIEAVTLASEDPKATATTNSLGQVDVSAFSGSRAISVTHVGYERMIVDHAGLTAAGTLYLVARTYVLDELVISPARTEERRSDVPEQITVIDPREIRLLDQPNTAELLQNSGALFVQKSQMGGGSPVIRGFEASRVLLVIDGVRMNNAIYRAGHLQDLITVDQNALERVEIISGPASVMYGSDALGGVVHLMTRTPRFADGGKKVGGEAYYRFGTAANEMTAHAGIELRGPRLASYTSITASDFGDLRQGSTRNPFYEDFGRRTFHVEREGDQDVVKANDDSNVQIGTAYKQFDVLQKLRLKGGEGIVHQLNLQLSTSSDVPRYDRLSEYSLDSTGAIVPVQAEWYYGPQKRLLAAYTLEWERSNGFFDQARFTPSYQAVEQSRHSRGWGSSRLGNNIEKVSVYSFNADLEKRIQRNELRYGLEYTFNDVRSEADREHVETGEVTYRTSRYPNGGSTMSSLAAYVSHTLEVNDRWVISEGLRFSSISLESTFNDTNAFQYLNGTVNQQNAALSWRAGAAFMPGAGWRLSALASTGFRAPNVDDMGKVFEATATTVVVPNPDLGPERTTNFEIGITKTCQDRYTIGGTAFYTLYDNAITIGEFTSDGSDSLDADGMKRVTALVNTTEAYLYGASGDVELRFNDAFTLRSTLTFTYGRIRTDSTDRPLDHVPPVYGRTGLEWTGRRFTAEAYALYNGWKRLRDYNLVAGSEDNIQYATAEGMPAWYTLNARASVAITKVVGIQLALENIADMNYRTFASGVSGPGRNFTVSLRAVF